MASDQEHYSQVVHHGNVNASVSYVARKTGLSYQETGRLLELALKNGDLKAGDYAGRRLTDYVDEQMAAKDARIAELEAWQEQVRSNSPLLARLERAEQRVKELTEQLAQPIRAQLDHWLKLQKLVTIDPDVLAAMQQRPVARLPAPLDTRAVVSDEALAKAFAGTDFGGHDHRDLLHVAVLKKACGYHCGHTITSIMLELGLIGSTGLPTAQGRRLISLAFHALMLEAP